MTIDAIEVAALELSEPDRERLAHRLIASLSASDDWAEEDPLVDGPSSCDEADVGLVDGRSAVTPESGRVEDSWSLEEWLSSFDSGPGLPR